jgi:hypothetical protein
MEGLAVETAPWGLTATKPAYAGSHRLGDLWMSTQVDMVAEGPEARIHSPANRLAHCSPSPCGKGDQGVRSHRRNQCDMNHPSLFDW